MPTPVRQIDSLCREKPQKLAAIRPPTDCARLPWTTQNWQHWKDVRKRALGAVAHAARLATRFYTPYAVCDAVVLTRPTIGSRV